MKELQNNQITDIDSHAKINELTKLGFCCVTNGSSSIEVLFSTKGRGVIFRSTAINDAVNYDFHGEDSNFRESFGDCVNKVYSEAIEWYKQQSQK